MASSDVSAPGFPSIGENDWRALAEKALKGEAFDSLVSHAEDGFAYGPIHTRIKDAGPLAALPEPMILIQRIDDPDPARANAQALDDLENGANGLALVLEGAPSAHGLGLPLDASSIERALDGVGLDMIRLRIEPHMDARFAIEALKTLCNKRGQDFHALDLDLGLDAMGPFAARGAFPGEETRFREHAGRATKALLSQGFRGRIAEADGRVFHDSGASEGQELGAILSAATYYLRAMTDAGLTVGDAAKAIGMTVALDQNQFFSIAKIRALRLLWARLLEACGEAELAPARIHCETSWRMMAARDPHTNIMRATVAGFAATVGGADSLSVLPYTMPLGLPDANARRLARNTQIILDEESGLRHVGDPGSGSGAVEHLTEELCETGWNAFRGIESEGGLFESLRAGALQSRVADMRHRRQSAIAEGEMPLIGVSLYPPESERPIRTLMPRREPDMPEGPSDAIQCPPLRPHRLTEELEAAS